MKLTSNDVNAISVIIQQTLSVRNNLTAQFMRTHAEANGVSSDAMKIINILLDNNYIPSNNTQHEKIAAKYYEWVVNSYTREQK